MGRAYVKTRLGCNYVEAKDDGGFDTFKVIALSATKMNLISGS
jgi:hypothetical protein